MTDREAASRDEIRSDLKRWAVSSDALFRPLEGEAVVLDMSSQQYFGLDPVGTRIWQLLDEHGTVEPIVVELLKEFEVEEKRLRADVEQLLVDLVGRGLIVAQSV